MSYPRNNATPPTFGIGEVRAIADGALQTTGASARVLTQGGSWGAAAGTLACDATSGLWYYAPSQGETNGTWFIVAVYKADCNGCHQTIIPSASGTAGQVVPADDSITAAKFDESTAYPLKSADTGATAVSRLTQTQISGGAYDLANATFVAAFKEALGTVPASGNWATAGAAMTLAAGSIVTATFGTCVLPKSPMSLATADVSGNIPANVLQWNTSTLPTIGTSTLTTGDIDARLAAWGKTGFSLLGTVTTLDALLTALASAHGAGSWATATGFSTHSASDVADLILVTPVNKLATNGSGYVTFANASIAVSGTVTINATTGWGGNALPTQFVASNMISDYQQRSVAVTLPTIPSGWITAAGIAASALNGKGDWLTTLGTNAPSGWLNAAAFASGSLNGKGDWLLATSYTAPPSTVVLATSQPNYAPAKAGDAMTLTAAYDRAKTAASATELAAVQTHGDSNWGGGSSGGEVTGYAEGMDPATLVLDALASEHNTLSTIGAKINAAGNAADPWGAEYAGYTDQDTFGYLASQLLYILQQVGYIRPTGAISAAFPVLKGRTLTIVAGASYPASSGRALQIALPAAPVSAANACSLAVGTKPTAGGPLSTSLMVATGTFVQIGSTWYASFDLTAEQTALTATTDTEIDRVWDLVEILSGGEMAVIYGTSPCSVDALIARE